jgi:Tfp pilus assembly protein PilF
MQDPLLKQTPMEIEELMMTSANPTSEQALDYAVSAIKRGDSSRGQAALAWVLQREPSNVVAWLWMAECLPESDAKQECLRRVTALSPFG